MQPDCPSDWQLVAAISDDGLAVAYMGCKYISGTGYPLIAVSVCVRPNLTTSFDNCECDDVNGCGWQSAVLDDSSLRPAIQWKPDHSMFTVALSSFDGSSTTWTLQDYAIFGGSFSDTVMILQRECTQPMSSPVFTGSADGAATLDTSLLYFASIIPGGIMVFNRTTTTNCNWDTLAYQLMPPAPLAFRPISPEVFDIVVGNTLDFKTVRVSGTFSRTAVTYPYVWYMYFDSNGTPRNATTWDGDSSSHTRIAQGSLLGVISLSGFTKFTFLSRSNFTASYTASAINDLTDGAKDEVFIDRTGNCISYKYSNGGVAGIATVPITAGSPNISLMKTLNGPYTPSRMGLHRFDGSTCTTCNFARNIVITPSCRVQVIQSAIDNDPRMFIVTFTP